MCVLLFVTETLEDEALQIYTKLQELDGASGIASLGLGQVFLARKEYTTARDSLQRGEFFFSVILFTSFP